MNNAAWPAYAPRPPRPPLPPCLHGMPPVRSGSRRAGRGGPGFMAGTAHDAGGRTNRLPRA
eukprot:165853-Hanusia_phi.AAC.1